MWNIKENSQDFGSDYQQPGASYVITQSSDTHLFDASVNSSPSMDSSNYIMDSSSHGTVNMYDSQRIDIGHQCSICLKKFTSNKTLRVHSNIHAGKKTYCNKCNKAFSDPASLRRHRKNFNHF
ncbi:unnamed protein product [Owenia fusiformis]|uniref:Uncharacterized protein n=1 Tax=Owenia fusiformis TaxID=6347 RepID=A0A8J1TID6_OWEFU|nr:unnamed protein product [Owenia fusiformis]